jgi:parallel beta-helix repeat protein
MIESFKARVVLFAIFMLLFGMVVFSHASPFDIKTTEDGLSVGIQPFMSVEQDGVVTTCFWAQLPYELDAPPVINPEDIVFLSDAPLGDIGGVIASSKSYTAPSSKIGLDAHISSIRTALITDEVETPDSSSPGRGGFGRDTSSPDGIGIGASESFYIDEEGNIILLPGPEEEPFPQETVYTLTDVSDQISYCIDADLQSDEEGRVMLPTSDPFIITIEGMVADPDPGCSATLNTANTIYTLTGDCQVNGTSAYIMNASNITLDCAGFSITGNNTTNTYGVFSNQTNTTIKNCRISNFSTGIYINTDAADYAIIRNNTINTTFSTGCAVNSNGCHGVFVNGGDYANISDNRVSAYQYGIELYNGANNGTVSNNTAYSTNYALILYSNANNNTIQSNNLTASSIGVYSESAGSRYYSNTITALTTNALYLLASSNNTVENNTISANSFNALVITNGANNNTVRANNITSATYRAVYISASSNNLLDRNYLRSTYTSGGFGTLDFTAQSNGNNITGNTINSTSTGGNKENPLYLGNGSNNIITNNTLRTSSIAGTAVIKATAASGNNTFSQNNLTGPVWVDDANGSNQYNLSGMGNIYYFLNGTGAWMVFNISSSGPALWADQGSSRPFSASTVGGNFTGSGLPQDWFPFTNVSTGLTWTWVNQTPADISSTNIVGTRLNITYSLANQTPYDTSSVVLYYKTNNTQSDCLIIVNGTAQCGYKPLANSSTNPYQFSLFDNQVYPATYNLNETMMENTTHTAQAFSGANNYFSVELLNVSSTSQYGFFEVMANTTAAGTIQVYYANSSYDFNSNPIVNGNVVQFCSIVLGPYNHTHTVNSAHMVCPFSMVNGSVGSVRVSSKSYFLIRGASGGSSFFYTIPNSSRAGATRTSANNFNTYTNQTYTVDSHLHQYSANDTFYYKASATTLLGIQFNSTERQDLINLSGIPPTSPGVYYPIAGDYNVAFSPSILIAYTAAVSPNQYPIVLYNISLLNANSTFNQTIIANNSPNLSYVWDITSIPLGSYIVRVQACDNQGLCSFGDSAGFNIINRSATILITYPVNGSLFGPGQCWLLLLYNLTYNYSTPVSNVSTTCFSFQRTGIGYRPLQSITNSSPLNFTGLNDSAAYAFNCTSTIDADTYYSQTVEIATFGASFCSVVKQNKNTTYLFSNFTGSWGGVGITSIISLPLVLIGLIITGMAIVAVTSEYRR